MIVKIYLLSLHITEKTATGSRVTVTNLKAFTSQEIAENYKVDYSFHDTENAKYIIEPVVYYG